MGMWNVAVRSQRKRLVGSIDSVSMVVTLSGINPWSGKEADRIIFQALEAPKLVCRICDFSYLFIYFPTCVNFSLLHSLCLTFLHFIFNTPTRPPYSFLFLVFPTIPFRVCFRYQKPSSALNGPEMLTKYALEISNDGSAWSEHKAICQLFLK